MSIHELPKLEKYTGAKSRFVCPKCNIKGQFTRYINPDTGVYYADNVGLCNRASNCGYHYSPKQYFADHPESKTTKKRTTVPRIKPYQRLLDQGTGQPEQPEPISYFPFEDVKASLQRYEINPFISFLKNINIPDIEIKRVIDRYYIGTSKLNNGSVIFWQIDNTGKVRTGKIMLYNPTTGKRSKEMNPTFVHSVMKLQGNYKTCYYGLHLTATEPKNRIAIVESEKTAILCDIYLRNIIPDCTWIATGNLSTLTLDRLQPFKDREILLFPDLNGFDKWKAKIKYSGYNIKIVNLLETIATESQKKEGLDIADYLIQSDIRHYRQDLFTGDINTPSKEIIAMVPDNVGETGGIKRLPYSKSIEPITTIEPAPAQSKIEPVQAIEIIAPTKQITHEPEPGDTYRPNTKTAGNLDNTTIDFWDATLNKIETILQTATIPTEPIKISAGVTIANPDKFIQSHLEIIKAEIYKLSFLPYLERLSNFCTYHLTA